MQRLIAVLGEHEPFYGPHQATDAASEHSRILLGADIDVEMRDEALEANDQISDEQRLG